MKGSVGIPLTCRTICVSFFSKDHHRPSEVRNTAKVCHAAGKVTSLLYFSTYSMVWSASMYLLSLKKLLMSSLFINHDSSLLTRKRSFPVQTEPLPNAVEANMLSIPQGNLNVRMDTMNTNRLFSTMNQNLP